MRRIAFVGNAAVPTDIADRVDSADWVVRFNMTHGLGGTTGTRIDDLFLINCGGQMHAWLQDDSFWQSSRVARTTFVSLPVAQRDRRSGLASFDAASPETRHGINFEYDVRHRLRHGPQQVKTMPDGLRRRAIGELGVRPEADGVGWPSTGFLALYWYLDLLTPDDIIELYGFSFQGAHQHPWARERSWVLEQEVRDRLRWHRLPVPRSVRRRS